MEVLSNLFGNNTKINANCIAKKDKNDKLYSLDNDKVILYDNSTGTNGNLTLEDNIENYRFYEVYFSREGNNYSSIRMSTDFLTNIQLLVTVYLGNITRLYTDSITISGTSLTRDYSRYINFPNSPTTYNVGANTGLLIYKIIGYK